MDLFLSIPWNPNPEIFSIGPLSIRWYGLMFVLAFFISLYIGEKIFKNDGAPKVLIDKLFIYIVVATIIGARLGHVFFYGWDYYQENLLEILLPIQQNEGSSMLFGLIDGWKFSGYQGLASHGAAIAIIIALWIFSKKISKKSILWVLDRVVVPVALAGCFIRLGNLMNSEIIGTKTDLPWGFQFLNSGVVDPETIRHPSQLYEAICYLISFGILMYLYWKTTSKEKLGLIFGAFLVLIFTARFLIEFVKEDQEYFEAGMALNMGQWLSIPFVFLGLYLIFRNVKSAISDESVETVKKT